MLEITILIAESIILFIGIVYVTKLMIDLFRGRY